MLYTKGQYYLKWENYLALFVFIAIGITVLGFILTKTKLKRAYWSLGQIILSLISFFLFVGKHSLGATGTVIISCFFCLIGALILLISCFFLKNKRV